MSGTSSGSVRSVPPGTALLMVSALLVGLVGRVVLVGLAPRHGYLPDHDHYVRWGMQAVDEGVLSVYDHGPKSNPVVRYGDDGQPVVGTTGLEWPLNYPPLFAYAKWVEGHVHKAIDPARTGNTLTSRAVYSSVAILADVLLALGCAAIVRQHAGPRAGGLAFAAAFLMPPLALDSALWSQSDAWLVAPAVWMAHAMQNERWRRAGVLLGVAIGFKTQGIMLLAAWLPALALAPSRRRVMQGLALAGLLLAAAAFPFWWHARWEWFHQSFTANLRQHLPFKTLYAFNLWYLDLLVTGRRESTDLLLGLTRDAWGLVLSGAGTLAGYWLLWRRWRNEPWRWTLLLGWVLLVAVTFAARIHERYVVLCLPFVIIAAFRVRRLWIGVAGLVLAATFQLTVYNWGTILAFHTIDDVSAARETIKRMTPPEQWIEIPPLESLVRDYQIGRAKDLPREWMLVVLSLLSTAWIFATLAAHGRSTPTRSADPPG